MKKNRKLRRRHRVKPKWSIIKNRVFWFSLLFLVIISIGFYFFIFFGKIQLTDIKISGNKKISTDEIKNIVSAQINRKILWKSSMSIFLAGKSKIANEILNIFPVIDDVKIEKKFPDTLILKITEKNPVAVFCGLNPVRGKASNGTSGINTKDSEKCFLLDKNGIIFENIVPEKELIIAASPHNYGVRSKYEQAPIFPSLVIIRFSENKEEFFLKQKLVEKELLDLILRIQENLKGNFQIDIKGAVISLPKRLDIKTSENWQIYFNLESDTDLQIIKLNLLLKQEITAEIRKEVEYIDLRFTRVYYK